jgi:glycosyltransferase involved in cell wall biosynthesis
MHNSKKKEVVKGLVSVIIPVYNRELLIADTLDSVLKQTYKFFEIIVVNDGSTDKTSEILSAYQTKFTKEITIINQDNQGQIKARNNGIKKAIGEYVAFLDSDDLWLNHKLEKQIPLFNKENIGLVFSGNYNINSTGDIIASEPIENLISDDIYKELLVQNLMAGGSVVVKKYVLVDIGLFDVNLTAAENWDLWIRICRKYPADFISEPLMKYRIHSGNMSNDSTLMLLATKSILDKHLSTVLDGSIEKKVYCQAFANYAYRNGLKNIADGNYRSARDNFYHANSYIAGYKDCNMRIFRTFLGRNINGWISTLRRILQ